MKPFDQKMLNYHAGRILLLIESFSDKRSGLDGLTKLAKLDFLVRYPMFLERLLAARGINWPEGSEPIPAERSAVESRMIRYRFGPWDKSYYTIIGILIGKGIVKRLPDKGKLTLKITPLGRKIADYLKTSGWEREAIRCRLLREHFDLGGTELKELVYREFEEELDMPWGAEIK